MRRFYAVLVATLTMGGAIANAGAQARMSFPPEVRPGDLIRVSSPARGLDSRSGRVEMVSGDSVRLRTGRNAPLITLRASEITTLAIADGRRRGAGATRGALIGGATGLILPLLSTRGRTRVSPIPVMRGAGRNRTGDGEFCSSPLRFARRSNRFHRSAVPAVSGVHPSI